MTNYEAILLDIDGTLVEFGKTQPTKAVIAAVREIRQQGVKIILATGRGPCHISPAFLGHIMPDYVIAFNGAFVMDANGKPMLSCPMSEEQFILIEEMGRQGHPVGHCFDDGYYIYHNAEKLITLSGLAVKDNKTNLFNYDNTRHKRGMPYVSFCNYPDELAREFNRKNKSLKLVYHCPNTYDLCQSLHDKSTAASWIFEKLDIFWPNVIAIGDGGNDIEMIEAAGMGVAMGNAPDFVKSVANYVADSVENDGAATAINHIFCNNNSSKGV